MWFREDQVHSEACWALHRLSHLCSQNSHYIKTESASVPKHLNVWSGNYSASEKSLGLFPFPSTPPFLVFGSGNQTHSLVTLGNLCPIEPHPWLVSGSFLTKCRFTLHLNNFHWDVWNKRLFYCLFVSALVFALPRSALCHSFPVEPWLSCRQEQTG